MYENILKSETGNLILSNSKSQYSKSDINFGVKGLYDFETKDSKKRFIYNSSSEEKEEKPNNNL